MKDTFLLKAKENLTVAEWCYANGYYNACANRAYYAAFQAAVVVLAHFGVLPPSERCEHRDIQSHFATQLIHQRKLFPNYLKSYLPILQAVRDDADYDAQLLSKSEATKQLRKAKEFIHLLVEGIQK